MRLRIAFLLATIGCGAGPGAPPRAVSPPPEHAEAAPGLRLPRTFVPTSYAARLAVVPSEPQFAGHIEIDGELASPSRVIWLSSQGLTFGAAVAVTAAGRMTLDAVSSPTGVVALRAPRALPAGHVTLIIDYRGALNRTSQDGLFAQQSGGAWYAFTQFEATSARRYMNALGEFADPALVAATLDLVLSGTIGLFEGAGAFVGETHTPAQRRAIYEAFKAHYDALAALLPPEFAPQLSQIGFVLCDPALRDDVVQFFRERLSNAPGGPHMLAMGVERMDSCLARHRAAQPSIHAFLAGY